MPPTLARIVLPYERGIAAWLCLCPLLAVASSWQIALALASCLLATIVLTAAALAALQRFAATALRLPLAALVAGTLAVLEQLALAAWWPDLDAAVAPWLVLAAGLAVLVCGLDESRRGDRALIPAPLPAGERNRREAAGADFARNVKWGWGLSMALLAIGVARDAIARVFLLADTPVGVLVLLALLLAGINFVMRDPAGSSRMRAFSTLGPALRPDDERKHNAASLRRNDGRT